jgi:hypothetical protein
MVNKYNDVTGTKRVGDNNPPPGVWVPFVLVAGVAVRALAAVWNRGKGAYWVHLSDTQRMWVDPSELVWQRELLDLD